MKLDGRKQRLFRDYSHRQVHFFVGSVPQLLRKAIAAVDSKPFSILDLGCGDGAALYRLYTEGLLAKCRLTVGVDLSPERIAALRGIMPQAVGIVADACNVSDLEDNTFDIIVCSQVIEHIPDSGMLLKEIRRLLRVGGSAYISSVVKKSYGFWIYRAGGTFRLDPTHLVEYPSQEAFIKVITRGDLCPIDNSIIPLGFPIPELILRLLVRLSMLSPSSARDAFKRWPFLRSAQRIRLPVPGYKWVETLCTKTQETNREQV